MRRTVVMLALTLPLLASDVAAQGIARRQPPAGAENAPRRQQLEARLRQQLWRVTKNRVGLTDAQMARLAQASRPFEAQRRQLAQQERNERLALRREILAGANADQDRIAASLDRVLDMQRRRAQLQIDEQRALAAFMTPMQRAKYAALQEQLRRRAENLRGQRVRPPRAEPLDSVR
ncbi:MAG TPA: hypothetical protein VFS59_06035 [Gemmatimonadaceae bacterium]|nr:hypothetical protein [Gemmatimonadaceae bacterium]